jgi:hypothetical protein
MSTGNGFVKRRRGILAHLREGRITLAEAGAHDVIGMLADKCTGIWFGSARAFAANCGAGDVTERQARHLLETLEAKGYLKRFATPRAHGNYPILVNKYEVTFGAHDGMRLNASATSDWHNPAYEKCLEQGAEVAPYQEVRREKKKAAARAAVSLKPEAWTGVGLDRPIGDESFRKFWETTWATKNGHPLSRVMGDAVDNWEASGKRVPARFFAQLSEIRKEEKLERAGTQSEIAIEDEIPLAVPYQ